MSGYSHLDETRWGWILQCPTNYKSNKHIDLGFMVCSWCRKVGRRAHFTGIRVDRHSDDCQVAAEAPQATSST